MATLAVIALALALLAGAPRPPRDDDDAPLVERVNALLPQTQCGQCLYDGCRPYAEAIIAGEANINRCPPGGQVTIDTLARLLGRPRIALDPRHGSEAPPRVAFIREDLCIGCKLCIKACPVDAILGSAKLMHTVIAAECTGCELCVAPCPVDCIDLLDVDHPGHGWLRPLPVPSPAGGA